MVASHGLIRNTWALKGPGDFDPPEYDDPTDEFDERLWASRKLWAEIHRLGIDYEPEAHVEEDYDPDGVSTKLTFTVTFTVSESETVTLHDDDAERLTELLAKIPTNESADDEPTPFAKALVEAGLGDEIT